MLSPTKKNLCEEDSSESDAGSEAGLEPETDRFGFIVSNGCTAGSVGPPPELVRQREAKWINIIVQWDRILLKKTSKVKVQCQKGIPASLRAKCWPLLCGATDRKKQNEELYNSLNEQSALQSWVDVIERDLDRQFPFHEMFLSKDGHGQRGLFRVLKAYTQYQPEEGYCQAQGPVAAVLLMNMPAEEAFWCLVQICEQYLPGYYSPLLEGVLFDAAILSWVLKRTCPAAHKHLQHHGVEPLMFATDWLMCLFTRHLPFNTLLRVWDLFFCYGVRVLLQVAVVLVRRVLGRAEQRKQCQGQMETLERLRGVREQVQDDDDAFIAEVCSVTLSARDLEKQTEKELEKWRKDRPASTFDPRGRCLGYRMVWERVRQNEQERNRKERETGNLSVPLTRSASTLSLSPSLLHRRWRKGGKVNTGDGEGGSKVMRHFSMGAKEDLRCFTELNFNKVQGVQEEEDAFFEEQKKQNELKLTGQTGQEEPKKVEDIQKIPTEQVEETVTVKEQSDQEETGVSEKEKSKLSEAQDSKMLLEQPEKTNEETQPTKDTDKDPITENIVQQEEELDSYNQSQDLEQQSHKCIDQEKEVKDTEKQDVESEQTAAVKENLTEMQKDTDADTSTEVDTEVSINSREEQMIQADMKPEEGTEIENVEQTQVEAVTEVSETATESSLGSETDSEAPPVKDPTVETETQQQDQEVITETDNSSKGDALEITISTESFAETDIREETDTYAVTNTDVLAQTQDEVEESAAMLDELEAEKVQKESEQYRDSKTEAETVVLCSSESLQPKEGTDLVANTETEVEMLVSEDIVRDSSETFAQCSEEDCDTETSEPPQETEERFTTVHSEVYNDETQAVETTETQITEETTDSTAPPQKEVTSAQDEQVNLIAEPDGETSSAEMSTVEEPSPEEPEIQASSVALEEKKNREDNKENSAGEEALISNEPTDSNTESKPQISDKESQNTEDQTELKNSDLKQAAGPCGGWSAGDFRIRKSSSSRGSRLGRTLSEDLFTVPQKTSQSQLIPNQPEAKNTESQSNSGTSDQTQTPPHVNQSSEVTSSLSQGVTDSTEVQQKTQDPPKRFGLFRKLRGEQPENTKAKERPKMQVPKILIQDFSDATGTENTIVGQGEEKLSSRERRRRRRERERREKEEERLRKKREKEMEKERERKKPQTSGKSFQAQKEKGSTDELQQAKTGSQTLRYSASYAESYF